MSLTSLISARVKRPTITVRFNGRVSRNILNADVSHSLEGGLSTLSLSMTSAPPADVEGRVTVHQGYNGFEQITFTGLIDDIRRDEYTSTWTVTARDVLKKALDTFLVQEVKFGVDLSAGKYYYSTYTGNNGGEFTVHEYNSLSALNANHPETTDNYSSEGVKAEAVVQWLLVMCGLQEGTEIRVDTTNFWIGDINPVVFHLTSVYDAIQQIAELIGWYIFSDQLGVVKFKKRPRSASGYTVWNYSSRTGQILKVSHSRTNADLRNYVEVQGASGIRVVRRASSPYLGTTPYRGVVIGNELIDTSGIATFVAERVLTDLNRLRQTVQLEVEGNPYLFPGQSVRVSSNVANGTYLIEDLKSNVSSTGGYLMSISASTYPGDTSFEEPSADIQALFSCTAIGQLGDPKIIAKLDGSASNSTRGPITTYSWEVEGAPEYSKTLAVPQMWVAFDKEDITNGNSVDVTLTVADSFGNTAFATSGITLAGLLIAGSLRYRHLYAALTTKAAASVDGGETWTMANVPAISVAASNFASDGAYSAESHGIFGGSDGKIYRTTDYCTTISGVATLGGRVTYVHIPETNSQLALAGTSEGKLFRSQNSGVNWSQIYDFGDPVLQAEYGYEDTTYVTVVTSGTNPGAWVSTNGGTTFNRLSDFGDLNMIAYTAGSATPYWAHGAGIVASRPAPDPVDFDGSATPTIVAATVNIDDDAGIQAVDAEGRHWTALSGVMNETAYYPDNRTRHMIRDGEMAIVTYYATQEGIFKSIDNNTTLLPLLTFSGEAQPTSPPDSFTPNGWGEMVAYGPLAAPITPGRLIMASHKPAQNSPQAGGSYQCYSVATNAGWDVITGSLPMHLDAVSVIPGNMLVLNGSDRMFSSQLALIKATVGGGFEVHPEWYTQFNIGVGDSIYASIISAQFSNDPLKLGTVHIVCADANLNEFNDGSTYRWGTVSNFTTLPSGTYVQTGENTSQFVGFTAGRVQYFGTTRLAMDDTLVTVINRGLIGRQMYLTHIDFKTGAHVARIEDDRKWVLYDADAKFTRTWGLLGRLNTGGTSTGVIEDPSDSDVTPASAIADRTALVNPSYQFFDAVYRVVDDELVRAGSYANGTTESIFVPEVGSNIVDYTVTPGPTLRTDCIAVLVSTSVATTYTTHFSTDGGQTWLRGPDWTRGDVFTDDGPYRLWYVSESA